MQIVPKPGSLLKRGNLQTLKLSQKINEGGEGTIYGVAENSSIVCKIYHHSKLTNLKREKIEKMLSKKISHKGICWPIDLVFNQYDEFVGYIMPSASGKTMQSSMFIKPQLVKNFPDFTRKDLVGIAISFLEKMKYLHSVDILVGDINALNILIEADGTLWFVDTDSYQIENFSCPVGTVNFTAPEIQGKDYASFLRTKNHELFAIATMVFMILFPGKPPYSQQGGESQTSNIKKMNFPYWCDEKAEVNPPEGPWNFIWSHLTRKVKESFCQTFNKNERTEIVEWIDVLKKYKRAIESGHASDELFPSGFPIKDPEEAICSGCQKQHTNSKAKILKMQQLGKGILCNDCLKAIKLKSLARQSNEERKTFGGSGTKQTLLRATTHTAQNTAAINLQQMIDRRLNALAGECHKRGLGIPLVRKNVESFLMEPQDSVYQQKLTNLISDEISRLRRSASVATGYGGLTYKNNTNKTTQPQPTPSASISERMALNIGRLVFLVGSILAFMAGNIIFGIIFGVLFVLSVY